MYQKLIIQPINIFDDGKFFNTWLYTNYPDTASINPDPDNSRLVVHFKTPLDQGSLAAISAFYHNIGESDVLEVLKQQHCEKIRERTDELVNEGFIFIWPDTDSEPHVFDLTPDAQRFWLALGQVFDVNVRDALLTNPPTSWAQYHAAVEAVKSAYFPLNISTIDKYTYEITSHAHYTGFVNTALFTAQSHHETGRALQQQKLAATTINELNAITDPR